MPEETSQVEAGLSRPTIEELVANRPTFVAFVQRRIGNRALAEEIVQDAFVRGLDRGEDIHESLVGWFYRVLRNAVIDRQRRQTVADRRLEQFAAELEASGHAEERAARACPCVTRVADTLKPAYADALRRIEVDGVAVKEYAQTAGISASNAGVRIFRAREALRKQVARTCGSCAERGCFDCTCQ